MPPKKSATKSDHFVFVSGSDESEVKKTAARLAAELAPADDPFGTETVDGNVTLTDEALGKIAETTQALLTLPFLGGAKLVWLKNAVFFGDVPAGKSDAVAEALEKLAALVVGGLPQGVTFLLSAPEPDKRRAAFKTFSKLGAAHLHDKVSISNFGGGEEEIMDFIAMRARDKGLKLDPEALELIAARVGPDSRQLDMELEKLSLACGEGNTPSAKDVRELVSATRNGSIFDLSNGLVRRDAESCLASLRQLFKQRESPVGILLAAITPTLRNMLLAKDLMERHRLKAPDQPHFFSGSLRRVPPSEQTHLPKKKDGSVNAYALGVAARGAARYTSGELINALHAARRANRTLVTTQSDPELLLGKLVAEIVG